MLKIQKSIFTFLFLPFILISILFLSARVWASSGQSDGSDNNRFSALSDLRITEIMYHPKADGAFLSNDLEFVELTNIGASSQDIGGVQISDGITYTFSAGTTLAPNSSVVVAKNPAAFQSRYGFAPSNSSTYEGQLRDTGETIRLSDSGGNEFLTVKYDNNKPLLSAAEGVGFSLVPTDPAISPSVRGDWRSSSQIHGSPGQLTPNPNRPLVIINEVLAHTDLPQIDFIELYNATGSAVDLSNWLITDNLNELTKFTIPAGTIIEPFGYLVFDQDTLGFAFNSEGDSANLLAVGAQGELTGHAHGFSFGASPNGVSIGRCTIPGNGREAENEEFVLQNIETENAANSLPQVGPVVISEIMYNGLGTDATQEFIELANISSNPVPLYDPSSPVNTWRIQGIGPFVLPMGASIPGNGTVLIVRSDPAAFRSTYNIPNTIAIYGPYDPSALNNDGERITLQKPDAQNIDGTVPYYDVDGVGYNDSLPWPTSADGEGKSLERKVLAEYGDSVLNWAESTTMGGTPGLLQQPPVVTPSDQKLYLPLISNAPVFSQLAGAGLMQQSAPCFGTIP